MAFGIKREELKKWKSKIDQGEIAFLTHYWIDDRFPNSNTVTKVGCNDLDKLKAWGSKYGLKEEWIDIRKEGYSHYDLFGEWQKKIMEKENLLDQLKKFECQ